MEIIEDELNIKNVTLKDDLSDFTSYSFKPQLRTVGPKYGKQLGGIREYLANVDGNDAMATLKADGALKFDVAGTEVVLAEDEYSWEKRDLKLEAGEHTEECIEAFNNLVFYDSKGINLKTAAEEYGFSEDNQFTLDWIITHPKEICEIVEADPYMVSNAVRDILR